MGERVRLGKNEAQVSHDRGAGSLLLLGLAYTCERLSEVRSSSGLAGAEKILGGYRCQHIVVIDHRIVEFRSIARLTRCAVCLHGKLADTLLVRHLSVGSKASEHGIEPRFDRKGLQRRHQQADGHQGVTAEIGVEAPGSRQQLLAIAQKRQRIARTRIGRRVGVQQVCCRYRGKRLITGQCRNFKADTVASAAADLTRDDATVLHANPQFITRSAIEASALVHEGITLDSDVYLDLGRVFSSRLIIAQEANA